MSGQHGVFVSIVLDKRRAKKTGLYPVKLRVFSPFPRKQKLYPTKWDFSEKDFKAIWHTLKPRVEYKAVRLEMRALEDLANVTVNSINPFDFDMFERKLFRKKGDSSNVFYYFTEAIQAFDMNEQQGSCDNYTQSLNSIKEFMAYQRSSNKANDYLHFVEVNEAWLKAYERFMIGVKESSITTVGIYLRPLRAVFNKAISSGDISEDVYPFGKSKFVIPTSKRVKKALTVEQLGVLYNAVPSTTEQRKARDFWFFSYACNGINIKDIALLRYNDISGNTLTFNRAKTLKTTRASLTKVIVPLNEFALTVIREYGKPVITGKDYVFDILKEGMTSTQQKRAIQNFTRFINQHIKKLCKFYGLPVTVSTYYARHSFATTAIRKGASLEQVGEALNHTNLKTTIGYFAGFEDDTKKELSSKIMDFETKTKIK